MEYHFSISYLMFIEDELREQKKTLMNGKNFLRRVIAENLIRNSD